MADETEGTGQDTPRRRRSTAKKATGTRARRAAADDVELEEGEERRLDESPIKGGVYQNAEGDHINAEGKRIDPDSGDVLDEDNEDDEFERRKRRAEQADDELAKAENPDEDDDE